MRIVIIGNGVAGIEAALTVRQREPDWSITIISEESDHFFSRTALMWVFCGQLSQRDIEPYERDLYDNAGFTRVRARATGVDVDRRQVLLAGGLAPIAYDRLLIACGSRPRPGPWDGSDLAGVGHFVTMQDLEWFEREVHGGPSHAGTASRPDAHLSATTPDSPYRRRPVAAEGRGRLARTGAVVGGGLIGIEAVEVMVAAGLKPTFAVREEWYWPMAIDRRESTWIAERMRAHGVDVRLEHEVEEVLGADGRVTGLRTDRGDVDAELVVVAIGVVPNTDWLEGSALDVHDRGGVIVDAGLATSAEGVFAAGDCALVEWFDGQKRPEQLWYTARDQGRIAGRALLGDRVRYDRGLWFNSAKLMDIEYTTAGLVNMQVEGERTWFYEETGAVRSTTRIVLEGDRVIGFNLLGRRWDHTVLLRWIEERRSLSYVLDHLSDASFDTELTPKLRIPDAARKQTLEGPTDNPARSETIPYPF